jgi:cytochrome b
MSSFAESPAAAAASAATNDRRIRVWDLPLRLFHWILVAAIAVAFLSSEEESALNAYHMLSGWVAAMLVAFRIVWGLVGGEHARFASFVKPSALGRHVRELLRGRPALTVGHNALGALSVILLLAFVAATVWTGATLGEGADEELHEVIAWSLLALVAVHVLAVLLMSLLTREDLISAMISGRKAVRLHPDARDARRPGLIGLALATAAVAGTVVAIRAFDPDAFTLRSTESFEHRQAGDSSMRDEAIEGEHAED